jgi:hypothetical protein
MVMVKMFEELFTDERNVRGLTVLKHLFMRARRHSESLARKYKSNLPPTTMMSEQTRR